MLNSTYKITKNTIKSGQSTQNAQGGALLVANNKKNIEKKAWPTQRTQ
jgi:hypothetical protein